MLCLLPGFSLHPYLLSPTTPKLLYCCSPPRSLGRLLRCLPSGVQMRAVFRLESVSKHSICPIHVHLLFLISVDLWNTCQFFLNLGLILHLANKFVIFFPETCYQNLSILMWGLLSSFSSLHCKEGHLLNYFGRF